MIDARKRLNSIIAFFDGIGRRRLNVYSASGSYYLFMSLVPIIMIICCLLPYTPLTQDIVLGYVKRVVTEPMAELVEGIVSKVYDPTAGTLTISILLTLFSASTAMKALMRGMDAAYDHRRTEHFLLFRLRAIIYMVILLTATLLSLCVMVYGGKIINLLEAKLPDPHMFDDLFSKLRHLRFLVTMCVLTVIFSVLYKWMPAEKVRYRDQFAGAVFTAVVWVAFSWVFSFYVSVSDKYGAYGYIGTVMIAMIWMYYCLLFLLIGGYLNSYLTSRKLARQTAEALKNGIEPEKNS